MKYGMAGDNETKSSFSFESRFSILSLCGEKYKEVYEIILLSVCCVPPAPLLGNDSVNMFARQRMHVQK
jgi:hypothetical protein